MSGSKFSKNEQQKNLKKSEVNARQQDEKSNSSLDRSNAELKVRRTSKSKTFTDQFVSDDNGKKGNNLFEKWGLTPEQVAEAEKFIIEIEEKVDECCPIRGSQRKQPKD